MEVQGYKAFNNDKTNRYNTPFIEGETYVAHGPIKFGNNGNGFHMCKYLSDVFRYFDSNTSIVAKVSASGEMETIDNDYYGYYDMYACEKMTIERFLDKEEIIDIILEEPTYNIVHFIQTYKMSPEEIRKLFERYQNDTFVMQALAYHQLGDTEVYKENKTAKEIKGVYKLWIK